MIELSEKEYTVGEVAEILNEEIYNLRYWQKELGLLDRRNEMNQRVYTQADINTFKFIKELRDNERLSLKAIRKVLRRAGVVTDEIAATNEVAVANNNNNNVALAMNRLKVDLLGEMDKMIERRNSELKDEIEDLREKIDYLETERNAKLDEFISEWREKNRKKGLIEKIFK
jgi:DNA-binding transcriptional MerR regulator